MLVRELNGKHVALQYSAGPGSDGEGVDDMLTVWSVESGKLREYFHPQCPDHHMGLIDEEGWVDSAVKHLRVNGIGVLYTPIADSFFRGRRFLGMTRGWDGEETDDKGDLVNWGAYQPLCFGDYNLSRLKEGKIDVFHFALGRVSKRMREEGIR